MYTLRELYIDIANDSQKWSYYSNPQCDIQGTWDDDAKASAFIKDYFRYAGKEEAFKYGVLEDLLECATGRPIHSISTFMLCTLFANMLDEVFSPYEKEGFNEKYYLFLICLYHDIGYAYENKCCAQDKEVLEEDGLEAVQALYDIQYIHNREFKTYTREELDIYFKGKLADNDLKYGRKPDHGIIGGLMLYDRLRKQFEYSWKHKTCWPGGRKDFYYSGPNGRQLHLSNSHYEDYAICADAIISHNVFFRTLNGYLKNAQQIEHTSLVALDGNPFMYLLALADTLEPIKRRIDLDQVQIERFGKTILMRLDDGISPDVLTKYREDINDLQSWMDISAHADDYGEVQIAFR